MSKTTTIDKFPPGTFIALLGIVAGIYTLFPKISPCLRIVGIVMICAFGFAEITLLYRTRERQDLESADRRRTERDQFEAIMRSFQVANYPIENLKRRAADLVRSLLEFFTKRDREIPRLPLYRGLAWYVHNSEATTRFIQNTMKQYRDNFSSQVIEIRDELKKQGFTDSELEKIYKDPTELGYVRDIAERIGALAYRLPGLPVTTQPAESSLEQT